MKARRETPFTMRLCHIFKKRQDQEFTLNLDDGSELEESPCEYSRKITRTSIILHEEEEQTHTIQTAKEMPVRSRQFCPGKATYERRPTHEIQNAMKAEKLRYAEKMSINDLRFSTSSIETQQTEFFDNDSDDDLTESSSDEEFSCQTGPFRQNQESCMKANHHVQPAKLYRPVCYPQERKNTREYSPQAIGEQYQGRYSYNSYNLANTRSYAANSRGYVSTQNHSRHHVNTWDEYSQNQARARGYSRHQVQTRRETPRTSMPQKMAQRNIMAASSPQRNRMEQRGNQETRLSPIQQFTSGAVNKAVAFPRHSQLNRIEEKQNSQMSYLAKGRTDQQEANEGRNQQHRQRRAGVCQQTHRDTQVGRTYLRVFEKRF